jgi:uncharacterized protein (DUF2062 family)
MPRNFFKRYMPSQEALRRHSALKPLGNLLYDPELWHLHRRSVSGACFVGLFCAFLPIPLQMLVAAVIALVARCNLPISVALVWITNPITMVPVFYFTYELGAWLLGTHVSIEYAELDVDWVTTQLDAIWKPLLLGSVICGWVSGVTAYVLVRILWRLHVVRRWRARLQVRRLRREAQSLSAELPQD